jgi:DNA-binding protein Fis
MYVYYLEGEWARQNIEVPLNGVWQHVPGIVSRTATLLGFSRSTILCVSSMIHRPKDIQGT